MDQLTVRALNACNKACVRPEVNAFMVTYYIDLGEGLMQQVYFFRQDGVLEFVHLVLVDMINNTRHRSDPEDGIQMLEHGTPF